MTQTKIALVVDDEPDICQLAEITLSRMGLDTRSANDVTTAKAILAEQKIDLCLTDMNLPDGNGIELVEHIQTHHPMVPVAVITAYGNMESAVRALKAGAFDFVSKPIDLQVLRNLVTSAIKLPGTESPHTDSSSASDSKLRLLGESPAMVSLRQKINKLARSQAPVFIHGESGSGKELVAHMIHQQGARSEHPFIPVNCGAIPSELMESEFFGHKKGSFTGATSDKVGLFEAANGGTLFLDEVADLPLQMQVKLLRAIQEKAVRPVGDHQEHPVDVRILSASHKDLSALIKQGQFREDLYYRINVIGLDVPSLRERSDDIPLLASFFMQRLCAANSEPEAVQFSDAASRALAAYHFPGNVRELENILERALALAENHIITPEDLQLPDSTAATLTEEPVTAAAIATSATGESAEPVEPQNLKEQEKEAIVQALESTRWNKTAAAKLLGLTLRQLRYRLQKLGID